VKRHPKHAVTTLPYRSYDLPSLLASDVKQFLAVVEAGDNTDRALESDHFDTFFISLFANHLYTIVCCGA
jgi:hypothetical protein